MTGRRESKLKNSMVMGLGNEQLKPGPIIVLRPPKDAKWSGIECGFRELVLSVERKEVPLNNVHRIWKMYERTLTFFGRGLSKKKSGNE